MAARKGAVRRALEADLRLLAERDKGLAEGAIAMSAVALATRLDDARISATAASMCQRALRETIDRLWELAPAKVENDRIDEVARKRAERRPRRPVA